MSTKWLTENQRTTNVLLSATKNTGASLQQMQFFLHVHDLFVGFFPCFLADLRFLKIISLSLYKSALLYLNPWLKSQSNTKKQNPPPKAKNSHTFTTRQWFPSKRAQMSNEKARLAWNKRVNAKRTSGVWVDLDRLACMALVKSVYPERILVPFLLKGYQINLSKAFCDLCRVYSTYLSNV